MKGAPSNSTSDIQPQGSGYQQPYVLIIGSKCVLCPTGQPPNLAGITALSHSWHKE